MTLGGTAGQDAIPVVNNGDPRRKWNLVVLGDGYQANELNDFRTHVNDFADTLHATRPFDANWAAINVYRIDVTSTDSGADDPAACGGRAPIRRRTSTPLLQPWGNQRLDRLLTVNSAKAKYIAKQRLPQTHQGARHRELDKVRRVRRRVRRWGCRMLGGSRGVQGRHP